MNNSKNKRKLSVISTLHYIKLFVRLALFGLAFAIYVRSKFENSDRLEEYYHDKSIFLLIILAMYAVEMFFRFFPSRVESMGCQKQFKRNYIPTGEKEPRLQSGSITFIVAVVWCGFNAIFGFLYYAGIIDAGILILLSLAYGVCDMICILFFCPFQTWIMKNRCCSVCRIYNWDFAMMFTPYVFIPNKYTITLLGMSLLLLLRWEISVHMHPERFAENTNTSLSCANCKEKLCHHKKQLQVFLKQYKA